jgi:CubicO group peptidase (beta-lactamase class C family)
VWHPSGGASSRLAITADTLTIEHRIEGSSDVFPWASVTKVVTALACLIAVEERSVSLDDPIAGGPGHRFEALTLAHLLAHTGGIDPVQPIQVRPVETRRVYSNASIRLAADHVSFATGMAFAEYVTSGVLQPLGMTSVTWGDPAAGAVGSIHDLTALAAELLRPTLISPETLQQARRPWWPDLDGVLPGFGLQRPCPWGLGFEVKGSKTAHWSGHSADPQMFGHFGQSGSLVAIDPVQGKAWCSLSPEPFGPWAREAWPRFLDEP